LEAESLIAPDLEHDLSKLKHIRHSRESGNPFPTGALNGQIRKWTPDQVGGDDIIFANPALGVTMMKQFLLAANIAVMGCLNFGDYILYLAV